MKKVIFIVVSVLFLACENKRHIIKKIHQKSFDIIWFRESYIENTRAFVTFEEGGAIDTILSGNDADITDIKLLKDTVLIKVFRLKYFGIYSKKNTVKNYSVVLKDASYNEWVQHYHPNEEAYPTEK